MPKLDRMKVICLDESRAYASNVSPSLCQQCQSVRRKVGRGSSLFNGPLCTLLCTLLYALCTIRFIRPKEAASSSTFLRSISLSYFAECMIGVGCTENTEYYDFKEIRTDCITFCSYRIIIIDIKCSPAYRVRASIVGVSASIVISTPMRKSCRRLMGQEIVQMHPREHRQYCERRDQWCLNWQQQCEGTPTMHQVLETAEFLGRFQRWGLHA